MQIINNSAISYLGNMNRVKCIFADPPDNLGLKYNSYSDNLHPGEYYNSIHLMIELMFQKADIFWLSYYSKHDLEINYSIRQLIPQAWSYRKIIWRYTFGQYNAKDFGRGYRPILRLVRPGTKLYPESILEDSARMRQGDSRASGPRLPDDVWDFPRVTGNSIERQAWHPTQHPVVIYDRIMKYSCGTGDEFVDLFAGSGTCFRAGLLNPTVNVTGVEIDPHYCDKMRSIHKLW